MYLPPLEGTLDQRYLPPRKLINKVSTRRAHLLLYYRPRGGGGRAVHPRADTHTPLGRHPPGRHPLGRYAPDTAAAGTHPTGMHSCFECFVSGCDCLLFSRTSSKAVHGSSSLCGVRAYVSVWLWRPRGYFPFSTGVQFFRKAEHGSSGLCGVRAFVSVWLWRPRGYFPFSTGVQFFRWGFWRRRV